ncbi:CIC11C00000003285 [Sungouiella intermedia]|uniref:CIC11C00000003285 n=1 Tax=Sungouiella intermedia TaxID=45354 RepID=A0A1L0DKH6_9ASCO|nr:CIC11C00000003285 [[Candida] intermedia]
MGAIYITRACSTAFVIKMQDTNCLGTLTREETIDIMERRQEAAVLRYIRQMSRLHEIGPLDDLWVVDVDEEHHEDFSQLNNLQIASIMASEQKKMEYRLERQMAVLRRNHADVRIDCNEIA